MSSLQPYLGKYLISIVCMMSRGSKTFWNILLAYTAFLLFSFLSQKKGRETMDICCEGRSRKITL